MSTEKEEFAKWWEDFLTGGIQSDDFLFLQKVKFINSFTLVGTINLFLFGFFNLYGTHPSVGSLEIFIGWLAIINLVVLRRLRKVWLVSVFLLTMMIVVLLVLFWTGGIQKTGILWVYTFPMLAFFLTGKRGGFIWSMLLWLVLGSMLVLDWFGVIIIAFSGLVIRQAFFSFLAVMVLIYFYEATNESILKIQKEKEFDLANINNQLQEEAQARLSSQGSLMDKNRKMEEVQKASLNILEDLSAERIKLEEIRVKDEALLGNIGEGVIAIGTNEKIIFINKSAKEMLGLEIEQFTGKKIFDFIDLHDGNGQIIARKDRPFFKALYTKMQFVTAPTENYNYVRRDGTRFPVFITATPIIIQGKVTGAIEVFRDITKEKEIDKAKSELSHQLRTPLTAIKLFGEMLVNEEAGKLKPKQKEYVQDINESTKRMASLVNDLLNVSRLELGKVRIVPEPTQLEELLRDVVKDLDPLIKNVKAKVSVVVPAKLLPKIPLDPALIRQVVTNLLSNSLKYFRPGKGHIEISVALEKNSKIAGSRVLITVKDDGIGIPLAVQGRIFEKFVRADNALKTATEGTGLGLYVCKMIVEASGGSIWFTSVEGEGTTFYVALPEAGMVARAGDRSLSA